MAASDLDDLDVEAGAFGERVQVVGIGGGHRSSRFIIAATIRSPRFNHGPSNLAVRAGTSRGIT